MDRYLSTLVIVCALLGVPLAAASNEQSASDAPIQRGYGQHDACFGDKYESDEDLKTGNELSVERILELLTQPGT